MAPPVINTHGRHGRCFMTRRAACHREHASREPRLCRGKGGTKQCGQRKAKEFTGHTELEKNKQGVCSAVEGKNSSAGPAKEVMRGRGMRPKLKGGGKGRERETQTRHSKKQTGRWFIPTNRRQPQQSIVMAKGTSFRGRKKKVVNLGRSPRMPTPPHNRQRGGRYAKNRRTHVTRPPPDPVIAPTGHDTPYRH